MSKSENTVGYIYRLLTTFTHSIPLIFSIAFSSHGSMCLPLSSAPSSMSSFTILFLVCLPVKNRHFVLHIITVFCSTVLIHYCQRTLMLLRPSISVNSLTGLCFTICFIVVAAFLPSTPITATFYDFHVMYSIRQLLFLICFFLVKFYYSPIYASDTPAGQ